MARSSTTRVGNGAGHGGPAKGEGSRVAGPGRGNTHRTVAELMAAQGARELAADGWVAILKNPEHPRYAEMLEKAARRLDGDFDQRITTENTTRYVVRAPAKTETVEEWEAQHKPPGL